jgi:hypothetical protein
MHLTLFHGKIAIGKIVTANLKNRHRAVRSRPRTKTGMSHATRRRTANVPVAVPIATPVTAAAPLARPSGRFDALVDMGNPMKGINLFPYLRQRVEGRALGALGPAAVLELSRTVREAALPRRWRREVFYNFFIYICSVRSDIISFFLSFSLRPITSAVARRVAPHCWFAG